MTRKILILILIIQLDPIGAFQPKFFYLQKGRIKMKKKFSSAHLIVLVLTLSVVAVLSLMWTASTTASEPAAVTKPDAGPPPTMVNYQGTLKVDGSIYEGAGYFKFAIMDDDTTDGTTNYWAHDGTGSGEPTTYVTLTVSNGLFNVLLGDPSVANMTQPITETVFAETNTYLRVWFSDTTSGFQALEPNQQFASVAYALRAQYAESYTETDPVFSTSAAATINLTMINNWNTAYGWMNHANAGYDTTDDDWADNVPGTAVFTNLDVGIGISNPSAQLHVIDHDATSSAPQFIIEKGPAGDAYQTYFQGNNGNGYSSGYDDGDDNYKITNSTSMTGGSPQGDATTMLQAHPSGILDFNNQSRARAFLTHPQLIPIGWWPIEFDDDFSFPLGHDQQNEYTLWSPGPTPPPTNAFFQATEEGYYQVHARTEFEYMPNPDQPAINPMGYVSIMIVVTDPTGMVTYHSQGNNLQMVMPLFHEIMLFNNAPNVSDVVYLKVGDMVEIHAWQDIDPGAFLSLVFGPEKTYVSIHKDS
jgi:hypothetical protein